MILWKDQHITMPFMSYQTGMKANNMWSGLMTMCSTNGKNDMNFIKKIISFLFRDPKRKDATTKVSGVGGRSK